MIISSGNIHLIFISVSNSNLKTHVCILMLFKLLSETQNDGNLTLYNAILGFDQVIAPVQPIQ